MNLFYKQFGADYNCGAYGADTYNSSQSCVTTTDSGSGSGLANTGTDIAIGVTGGVLLIVVGLAMLVRTRRKSKRTTQAND